MNVAIEKQFISKLRYESVDNLFSTKFPTAVWVDIPGTNPVVSATTVIVEFGKTLTLLTGIVQMLKTSIILLK